MKFFIMRTDPQLLYLVTLMLNLRKTVQLSHADTRSYEGVICRFSRFESLGHISFVRVKCFGHCFLYKTIELIGKYHFFVQNVQNEAINRCKNTIDEL